MYLSLSLCYSFFLVIRSPDGRRNIMHLTHSMVKMFCGNLDMKDDKNFPHLTRMNNGGTRLSRSVRVNHTKPDEPKDMLPAFDFRSLHRMFLTA